jgi:hypothetical protein
LGGLENPRGVIHYTGSFIKRLD